WAWIDAQGAEHALGVIDLEAIDPEALADRILDLLNVNAIDGAGAGALVAADARRQIEAVKPAVARLHGHGQLGVLELLGEGPALVGLEEVPERDVHALAHRLDRKDDIADPLPHGCSRCAGLEISSVDVHDYRICHGGRKGTDAGLPAWEGFCQ